MLSCCLLQMCLKLLPREQPCQMLQVHMRPWIKQESTPNMEYNGVMVVKWQSQVITLQQQYGKETPIWHKLITIWHKIASSMIQALYPAPHLPKRSVLSLLEPCSQALTAQVPSNGNLGSKVLELRPLLLYFICLQFKSILFGVDMFGDRSNKSEILAPDSDEEGNWQSCITSQHLHTCIF